VEYKFTRKELSEMLEWPLDKKVFWAMDAIYEFYRYNEGKVYISFSGGKDSCVLLDLVRKIDKNIPAVFIDTGLEYPEIREHARKHDNVIWLRPEMTYNKVIETYGIPVISKRTSEKLYFLKNPKESNKGYRNYILTGYTNTGKYHPFHKLSERWKFLVDSPYAVSHRCCDILKKNPVHKFERQTKLRPYLGLLASESQDRMNSYLVTGCNSMLAKSSSKSMPLSLFTEENIWEYSEKYNVKFASIYYDREVDVDGKRVTVKGVNRTGCSFCLFGLHMEKGYNRLQKMQLTHPKIWNYIIYKVGFGYFLDFMNENVKGNKFRYSINTEELSDGQIF
jgi:3'-phosphoadenosine 5'-phosphosulfate sulfotransferase (PAPS reductase)/FAD synthetase